jgi:hypothetical protein
MIIINDHAWYMQGGGRKLRSIKATSVASMQDDGLAGR